MNESTIRLVIGFTTDTASAVVICTFTICFTMSIVIRYLGRNK